MARGTKKKDKDEGSPSSEEEEFASGSEEESEEEQEDSSEEDEASSSDDDRPKNFSSAGARVKKTTQLARAIAKGTPNPRGKKKEIYRLRQWLGFSSRSTLLTLDDLSGVSVVGQIPAHASIPLPENPPYPGSLPSFPPYPSPNL